MEQHELHVHDVVLDSGKLGPVELSDRIVETALKLF